MPKHKRCLAMLAAGLAAALARAHGDEAHGTAVHGGQVAVAGDLHYELVVVRDAAAGRESPLTVYVTDRDGREVATAGASGTATILAAGRKLTVDLAPAGGNRLAGAAGYQASPAMKVLVAITVPGREARTARFTPLAAP